MDASQLSELREQIHHLPIQHLFEVTPAGEVRSRQRLIIPRDWLAPPVAIEPAWVEGLGPFYFKRLTTLSWGLIRVRSLPEQVRFELLGPRLTLLAFDPAKVSHDPQGGESCYTITGGLMLAAGARPGGLLCVGLRQVPDGLLLSMEIKQYYSRLMGSGQIHPLRRLLYERSQALAHHYLARDFVRSLALGILSGTYGEGEGLYQQESA